MPMPKQKPGRSKQDYSTPWPFVQAVHTLLHIQHFEFDFAAAVNNRKGIGWWGVIDDSLSQSVERWAQRCNGGWGWLNPPFSDIAPWVERCLRSMHVGARIAFLVPASVGSNWYRDFIHNQPGVTVLFLNGRIAFDPNRPDWGYPKDCMLILFDGKTMPGFSTDVWNWRIS